MDVFDDILEQQPPLTHLPFKGLNPPLLVDFHNEKGKECPLPGAAASSPIINDILRSSGTFSSSKKKVCRALTGKRPPRKEILRKDKQCEDKERSKSP